jgi:glycosyltransferase involved in cell wall biosynthesis
MKRKILLNWLPFENYPAGSAKRAIELHTRLSGEFDLTAIVTDRFPLDVAPHINKKVVQRSRGLLPRVQENFSGFWCSFGEFSVWMTDTLPVPRFGRDVRVLLTVHDLRHLADRRFVSRKRDFLLKLCLRSAISRASGVVTVSQCIKRQLIEHYGVPEAKLHVIPNAAASLPIPESEHMPKENFLLAVGHLQTRKDYPTLMKAFATISSGWSGRLVIAGGGVGERDLRILAEKLGIENRTQFLGKVSDADLAALYRSCAALVCPSLYEGFGMTILEGMAARVPVIASRIPAHEEVGGDAVSWFKPGDSIDLANTILSVLNSSLKYNIEKACQHSRLFDWDSAAAKLAELYRAI